MYSLIKWDPEAMNEILIGDLDARGPEICVIEMAQRIVRFLRFTPEESLLLVRHIVSQTKVQTFYETLMIPIDSVRASIRSSL